VHYNQYYYIRSLEQLGYRLVAKKQVPRAVRSVAPRVGVSNANIRSVRRFY
jgi:hypothetical protein